MDNISYCKEMLEFAEIRHLDGDNSNFEVCNEKEYVDATTLQSANKQTMPQLIYSNLLCILLNTHLASLDILTL
jgi:hypothetical protein